MAKVGYARVSTSDQNLDLQIDSLKKYGCDPIFIEKQSGATLDRAEWKLCYSYLRPGDTLVLWKLDRLGRRAGALLTLIDDLKSKSIDLVAIKENLNADSPMGKAMMQIICIFSEMERNVIAERTKAGIEAARKKKNFKIGRPKKITDEDKKLIRAMIAENISISEISKRFKVNPSTIWRAVGSKDQCNMGT